jgi:hypothetical protein
LVNDLIRQKVEIIVTTVTVDTLTAKNAPHRLDAARWSEMFVWLVQSLKRHRARSPKEQL